MNDSTRKRILLVVFTWIIILSAAGYFAKRVWFPSQKEQLLDETSSAANYKHHITLAADQFSGYDLFRSPVFRSLLKQASIKVTVKDEPNYSNRIRLLADQDVQCAVFTIDSFIKSCIDIGDLPASIVMIVDETVGADAIVAFKDSVHSISDLNNPNAKIVVIPNSPSEFISRIVVSEFNLPLMSSDWPVPSDSIEDVYKKMQAGRGKPYAYAMWEPYVSKALQDKNVHVLLDSSKLSGYIVDVLVFERKFLKDNPDLVQLFIECYQRAHYFYESNNKFTDLIQENDKSLSSDQAQKVAKGILWKSTVENYAHFGLQGSGLPHIEDMIISISSILVHTGLIPEKNLITGNESKLFYDAPLVSMRASNFHPAKKTNILGFDVDLGKIRERDELPPLSDKDWSSLLVVGDIKTNPIQFGRGTSDLTTRSQRELRDFSDRMGSLPNYYIMITGQTSNRGDVAANKEISKERADAVASYLINLGMNKNRIRTRASDPGNSISSVTFVVGQRPY